MDGLGSRCGVLFIKLAAIAYDQESAKLSNFTRGGQQCGTGAYSVTIPAGSFKKDGSGRFTFEGAINRVKLEASIQPFRSGAFEFAAETEGANLKGFANPVTVSLTIGDDSGRRVVRAKIE